MGIASNLVSIRISTAVAGLWHGIQDREAVHAAPGLRKVALLLTALMLTLLAPQGSPAYSDHPIAIVPAGALQFTLPNRSAPEVSIDGSNSPTKAVASTTSANFGSLYPASGGESSSSTTWGPITNPNSVTVQVVATLSQNPQSAFSITSGTGTINLGPGQSMSVTVKFSNVGQSAGTKTSQLKVQWQQTSGTPIGDPVFYNLTGYVARATSLGGHGLNAKTYLNTPYTGSALLSNHGTLPLGVSAKTLTGAGAVQFRFVSQGDASATTIPAGGDQDIRITYLAELHGNQSAYLTMSFTYDGLSYNASNYLPLQGQARYRPDLTGSSGFDAGTPIQGNPVDGTARLINAGSQPLAIIGVSLGGADAARFQITGGNLAGDVAAGQSRAINIRYLASSVGTHAATLHVSYTYDGGADSVDLNLAGHTFGINQKFTVNLTLSGSGSGTVLSTPSGIACNTNCSALFPANTSLSLHPAASPYSLFSGWTSGECSGTTDCPFVMNSNRSMTAAFDKDVIHQVAIGKPPTYFPSIQAAYAAAKEGDVINIWALPFDENLLCNRPVGITFRGGYDDRYSAIAGKIKLKGTLKIRNGRVVADGVSIE